MKMNIRVSADQAGWSIREAAWDLEERVLWRGSDAARETLERGSDAARDAFARAGYRLNPLHRLIQTRLTWPLGDAFRARGRAAQTAIVASAAAVAIAAGSGGATLAPEESPSQYLNPAAVTAASATGVPVAETTVLQGVAPEFQAGDDPVPVAQAPKPSAEPAQVAWQFAQAFVAYEVGRSSDKTDAGFAETATKPLLKALAEDPPRLPADTKIPQARVLNVVLGEAAKEQVTASVSIVRMRSISEVRLTLTKEGAHWRVAQVLG
jgi:hypothetical protein